MCGMANMSPECRNLLKSLAAVALCALLAWGAAMVYVCVHFYVRHH
jgi:hypothetical protein